MRISPIITNFSKSSFKGRFGEYNHFNTEETIKPYPNSTVEKTLGNFHPISTGKAYFADPMEVVTDKIKEQADYVVYDNEPEFPDVNRKVSRSYFGEMSERADYHKQMNDFREYFYRLEMRDRVEVGNNENKAWNGIDKQKSREKAEYYKARVRDAQYNQETAATCMNIYNESESLRGQKVRLEDRNSVIEDEIKATKENLAKAQKDLADKKELNKAIDAKLDSCSPRLEAYLALDANFAKEAKSNEKIRKTTNPANLRDNAEKHTEKAYTQVDEIIKSDVKASEKERAAIQKQLLRLQVVSAKCLDAQSKLQDSIKAIEKFIADVPGIIAQKKGEIKENTVRIDKIKGDLIPLFDKLKNYFYSRGIKSVKY